VYIDEVDKLTKKVIGQISSDVNITATCNEVNLHIYCFLQAECNEDRRDVSGEGVQQALLKIFEGTVSASTNFLLSFVKSYFAFNSHTHSLEGTVVYYVFLC
jgi:hypothetical protein